MKEVLIFPKVVRVKKFVDILHLRKLSYMSELFEKARSLESNRDYERAIFYYSLILFDDALNYAALHSRGYCKLQEGKAKSSKELISDAIKDFERSISIAGTLGLKDNIPVARKFLEIANKELQKTQVF